MTRITPRDPVTHGIVAESDITWCCRRRRDELPAEDWLTLTFDDVTCPDRPQAGVPSTSSTPSPYVCPSCGWVPPFPIESDADWADMLAVHRMAQIHDDEIPRPPTHGEPG